MHPVRQGDYNRPEYPVTLQNVDTTLADTLERAPIPVFTQNWQSIDMPQWIPRSGLDFLRSVEQVEIQQTIELHDLLASVESENRFLVKVPGGETLFVAAEESSATQRLCFGSSRAFRMRILDAGRQEVLRLKRQLACRFGFLGCCFLQQLDVATSRGAYIGRVKQEWSFIFPQFTVRDELDRVIYRLHGPETWFFCSSLSDVGFKILSPDGQKKGTIIHCWRGDLASYCISISFPPNVANKNHKALLLSTAFLLQLDVATSRGTYIGRVKQEWSFIFPQFAVRDELDRVIYRLHGPETWFFCSSLSDVGFKILSPDGQEKGTIIHCWRGDLASYCISISFPPNVANKNHKALLLSTAFLLEYMFFEQSQRRRLFLMC